MPRGPTVENPALWTDTTTTNTTFAIRDYTSHLSINTTISRRQGDQTWYIACYNGYNVLSRHNNISTGGRNTQTVSSAQPTRNRKTKIPAEKIELGLRHEQFKQNRFTTYKLCSVQPSFKSNTHRWRRRDSTVGLAVCIGHYTFTSINAITTPYPKISDTPTGKLV